VVQPFPAYHGDGPYIFVSYSHEDDAVVFQEIRWLQDQGINVWYDEGIRPGSEWTEALAQAIKNCSQLLYFITPQSVASENCRRELNFALAENRPVLAAHLQETNVPDGVRFSLDNRQAILKYKLGLADYRQALLQAVSSSPNEVPRTTSQPESRGKLTTVITGIAVMCLLVVGTWWLVPNAVEKPQDDRIRFESIAVLPFEDKSVEQDLGPLADLVTHELITRLDELPTLRVASLAAVAPLVQRDLLLSDIARSLETPLVLSGYLQRDGELTEAVVQVVRASDGHLLWSSTLARRAGERPLVARFFATELSQFVGSVSNHPQSGPDSPAAYRAWLNWHYLQANRRNWDEVKWIEQVIRLEPTYTWAYLDAFQSYFSAALDGQDRAWVERARGALEAAKLAGLAEEGPRYQSARGQYLFYLIGDLDRGETALREIGDPRYSILLLDSGVPEPAIKMFEGATSQQPSNPGLWLALGTARGVGGDLSGALHAFEQGLRRSPDHPYLLLQEARALIFLGRYEEARLANDRLASLGSLPPGGDLGLRGARYRLQGATGDTGAALEGAEMLAADGWHATAGNLFLFLGDPRASEQFELAALNPIPGRRMTASWLNAEPSRFDHPIVKPYLESLGYTDEWRREICTRAIDYASANGVELDCDKY